MAERRSRDSLSGLRLLMTTDTVGGVFTYALTLATELTRRGVEVHLATMGPSLRPAQRRAAAAIERLFVHESTFALEWMPEPWDDVERGADWLLALERDLAIDLVHLNGYCHGAAGFRAPVLVAGHSCVVSWWDAVFGGPPPPEFDRYTIEVRRGIANADAVVSPTAAMMGCLERHYGPLRHSVVVSNGVPRPERPANVTKAVSVLAAGRLWDRGKNVEALARVARFFPGEVRLAGGDVPVDGSPNVVSLGWLEPAALAEEMERASIFAHPARYEPFGLCPVEAALRGCALLLGDIESLREVWNEAAMFVDPNDDAAIADALALLARDADFRDDLAKRAMDRASSFTPERMTDATVDVYLGLLREDTAHPARKGAVKPCA